MDRWMASMWPPRGILKKNYESTGPLGGLKHRPNTI